MPSDKYLSIIRAINLKNIIHYLFQYPRLIKYRILSDCKNVVGKPRLYQPLQICGKGMVEFHQNVKIGVKPCPFLYSGYAYIDSRGNNSKVTIGKNSWINNNFTVIAEGEGVEIGADVLIGNSCMIMDSDFHALNPQNRFGGQARTAKVSIGNNVFIGANVVILKGVTIGNGSVIASGSVVCNSIPANAIAGGVPAKIIRSL
jgi:acetyltransferase-like isoleucine patch superfamily enzyme